jgi:Spy/CpxP family protein refolding chaperone
MNVSVFAQPAQQTLTPEDFLNSFQNKFRTPTQNKVGPLLDALNRSPKSANTSPFTALQATVGGTFWRNPVWVKTLELSPEQQEKMDDIFRQYRLKLIDLNATLEKEELILEPLFGSTRPSPEVESKVMTQIDRIADARAELEKANSRMLLSILQVMTAEQWSKLPAPGKKTFFFRSK